MAKLEHATIIVLTVAIFCLLTDTCLWTVFGISHAVSWSFLSFNFLFNCPVGGFSDTIYYPLDVNVDAVVSG